MDRLHARYPFLASAKQAVEEADIDLATLITEGSPAVERGRERVELGLSDGHTGDPRRSARIELLSYPIARVLVSLLNEPMAVETYARSEAATARERLGTDLADGSELRSTETTQVSIEQLLQEFGLNSHIDRAGDEFRIDVTTYLRLSRNLEGNQWHLVNRTLTAGRLAITRAELLSLLEQAVTERVEDGLPLSVPDQIAAELTDHTDRLRQLIETPDVTLTFDAVVPEAFPPCITALLEQAQAGETLSPPAQFALVGFLAGTPLDADGICELADSLDRETVAYQLAHIRNDRDVEYPPPSCTVMDAYGLCVNQDERCAEVTHPAQYYHRALQDREPSKTNATSN